MFYFKGSAEVMNCAQLDMPVSAEVNWSVHSVEHVLRQQVPVYPRDEWQRRLSSSRRHVNRL